jgi:hypothetical protein
MSSLGSIGRVAIAACGAFSLFAAAAWQDAVAQSGLPIRNIQVDVAPLRANVGDPTASWVEQGLTDQLQRALAGRMAPQGGTLIVRIDHLTLGPNKDSAARDDISGVATIGGDERPVRATTRYQDSAIDPAMVEESNHRRVTQLVEALTYWLARDL